jgi:hypothetical protein
LIGGDIVRDRVSGVKLQLCLSGANPSIYWLSAFLVSSLVLLVPTSAVLLILRFFGFYPEMLREFVPVVIGFCLSWPAFIYCASWGLPSSRAINLFSRGFFVLCIVSGVLVLGDGVFGGLIAKLLEIPESRSGWSWFLNLFPPYALYYGLNGTSLKYGPTPPSWSITAATVSSLCPFLSALVYLSLVLVSLSLPIERVSPSNRTLSAAG